MTRESGGKWLSGEGQYKSGPILRNGESLMGCSDQQQYAYCRSRLSHGFSAVKTTALLYTSSNAKLAASACTTSGRGATCDAAPTFATSVQGSEERPCCPALGFEAILWETTRDWYRPASCWPAAAAYSVGSAVATAPHRSSEKGACRDGAVRSDPRSSDGSFRPSFAAAAASATAAAATSAASAAFAAAFATSSGKGETGLASRTRSAGVSTRSPAESGDDARTWAGGDDGGGGGGGGG